MSFLVSRASHSATVHGSHGSGSFSFDRIRLPTLRSRRKNRTSGFRARGIIRDGGLRSW